MRCDDTAPCLRLISGANTYTEIAFGCVTLRASTHFSQKDGQRLVRIMVSDNGHGIGRSALSNLFQPFFTTRGLVGNGLGLWVSKQIIEKHGGKIQVRSRTSGPRQGTTFSVVLPVAQPLSLSSAGSVPIK